MSNAAKHRKKAAEYEQLKQIDRAIASYVRAIEESEAEGEDVDVALLNKVGDLALRQGRVPDAVTYYERAVEHYATAALFNNAIALCNKILRNAPGRSNVYFTLGRICARKGLRGDATRNFLEYATRMQQESRLDEAMRALSEVADLMPELEEVRRLVDEHAARAGVELPRRRTPVQTDALLASDAPKSQWDRSSDLVFLDVDYGVPARRTPPKSMRAPTPPANRATNSGKSNALPFLTPVNSLIMRSAAVPIVEPLTAAAVVLSTAEAETSAPSELIVAGVEAPTAEIEASAAVIEAPAADIEAPAADIEGPTAEVAAEFYRPSPIELLAGIDLEPVYASVQDTVSTATTPIAGVAALDGLETPFIESVGGSDDESSSQMIAAIMLDDLGSADDSGDVGHVEPGHIDIADLVDVPPPRAPEMTGPLTPLSLDRFETSDAQLIAISSLPDLADLTSGIGELTNAIDDATTDLSCLSADASEAGERLDDVFSNNRATDTPAPFVSALPVAAMRVDETQAEDAFTVDDAAHELFVDAPFASDDDSSVVVGQSIEADPVLEQGPNVAAELTADATSTMGFEPDALSLEFPASVVEIEAAIIDDELSAESFSSRGTPVAASALPFLDLDAMVSEPCTARDSELANAPVLVTPVLVTPVSVTLLDVDVEVEVDDESGVEIESDGEADFAPQVAVGLDEVIGYGRSLVASPTPVVSAALTRRPPFRLDPHDFILPGELPPLLVDDALVDAGLRVVRERAAIEIQAAMRRAALVPDTPAAPRPRHAQPAHTQAVSSQPRHKPVHPEWSLADHEVERDTHEAHAHVISASPDYSPAEPPSPAHHDTDVASLSDVLWSADETSSPTHVLPNELGRSAADELTLHSGSDGASPSTQIDDSGDESEFDSNRESDALLLSHDDPQLTDEAGSDDESFIIERRVAFASAMSTTPSLPIAAVAAEAKAVAASRRVTLQVAVADAPTDWSLRRRLGEALFEAGERSAGMAELEAALSGLQQAGLLSEAADVAEVLVGVSPERVSYHQKRVELAVRLEDQQRLRFAYLDLADTLIRSGEEVRAQAVYVRVLEIDPYDVRARAALGTAAPPPPTPVAPPDEQFVNLADWLRDDIDPASTRMRMQEPVASGDEEADFASLLRHFKEGVSRSLGEEDFESRYDLGVAFKEMGLLDDAIAEFQKALRSRAQRLPTYEALGQCFVEQGRYQVAVTVLSRALHEPGLNDEQRVGVLYLLAYSCEALQRWGEARSYFQRVYATDINFRDVAARLAALEQVAP